MILSMPWFQVEVDFDHGISAVRKIYYGSDFKELMNDLLKTVVVINDGKLILTKEYQLIKDKAAHRVCKVPEFKIHSLSEWRSNFVQKSNNNYRLFQMVEVKDEDGNPKSDRDGNIIYERKDMTSSPLSIYEIPLKYRNFMYHKIDPTPCSPLASTADEPKPGEPKLFRAFRGFTAKLVNKVNRTLIQPILNHFKEIWANNNNNDHYKFIMRWLAHCFRHPDEQSVAMVLCGKQGTGKTSPMEFMMKHIWGHRYSFNLSSIDEASTHFNSHLFGKMLINVQEVEGDNYGEGAKGKRKAATNKQKSPITDEMIQFNKKFADSFMAPNIFRWFMTSNFSNFLFLTEDDRRYFIKEISDRYATGKSGATEYHKKLRKSFTQEVADHLFTYLLTDPQFDVDYDEVLRDIPMTETKREIIDSSRYTIEDFVVKFAEGYYGQERLRGLNNKFEIVDNEGDSRPINDVLALTKDGSVDYVAMSYLTIEELYNRVNGYKPYNKMKLDDLEKKCARNGSLYGYLRRYRPAGGARYFMFVKSKMTWWDDGSKYLSANPYLEPRNIDLFNDSKTVVKLISAKPAYSVIPLELISTTTAATTTAATTKTGKKVSETHEYTIGTQYIKA